MQLLHDFFPVLVFFGVFKWKDIYWATGALMVALALQTAIQYARTRKVSNMSLASLALVGVFGGLTIALRDEKFIQWKVTVVNWLFALVFLASQVVGEKPIVERMLGAQLRMEPARWRQLNLMWVVFFVTLGAVNLVLMHTLSPAAWVTFKTFGLIGATVAFVLLQGLWLSNKAQMIEDAPAAPAAEAEPEPAKTDSPG